MEDINSIIYSYEEVSLINSMPYKITLLIDIDTIIVDKDHIRTIIQNQFIIYLARITKRPLNFIENIVVSGQNDLIESTLTYKYLNDTLNLSFEQKQELYINSTIQFPINSHLKADIDTFTYLSKYVNIIILSHYPYAVTKTYLEKNSLFDKCQAVIIPDPLKSSFDESISKEILQDLKSRLKNEIYFFTNKNNFILIGNELSIISESIDSYERLQNILRKLLIAFNLDKSV